jgi:hypothetical protein
LLAAREIDYDLIPGTSEELDVITIDWLID